MPISKDGRYKIITSTVIMERRKMEAYTDDQKRIESEQGPLFQIIYSTDMWENAMTQEKKLREEYKGRVRINMVPARAEFEALCKGDFEVEELVVENSQEA